MLSALWDLVDKWRDAASNITDENSPYLSKEPKTAWAQAMNEAAEDLSDCLLEEDDDRC
jgi:hypothetical protein